MADRSSKGALSLVKGPGPVAPTPYYPAIEPYGHGMLDVGDGHRVYWEECGNPDGKPVVVLHGGPGSGCTPVMRQYFDPAAYRIILFDQRGCGRNTPRACDDLAALDHNTTHHLLADMERLRALLIVEKWMVLGVSWGATLGLAYAESHPDRVSEIVLLAVTMTRPAEISWLTKGAAKHRPEAWTRFRTAVPKKGDDIVEDYYWQLQHPLPFVCHLAAQHWNTWEWSLVAKGPDDQPAIERVQPLFQLTLARIITHYFHHKAWLEDNQLLHSASALAGIPGILIQGADDLSSFEGTAQDLAAAWPDATLILVGGAGHKTSDLGMAEALIDATDQFRE
jgi:proline iminopeptidase